MTEDNFDYTLPINTWGEESQKLMMIEECSELIKAILKEWRGGSTENVIEELADVQIMLNQMIVIYEREEFEPVMKKKLDRLRQRIKHSTKEKEKEKEDWIDEQVRITENMRSTRIL